MKTSRITAAVVLAATVLFGSPVAADAQSEGSTECQGQEIVDLMDTRIYAHTNGLDSQGNPWQSSMVWDLNPVIPGGTYDVQAISWDEYVGRAGDNQANERWFVEFLGEGDKLLDTSEATGDVPDGVAMGEMTSNIGQLTFSEPVRAVRTVHAGSPDGSADSVLMNCLGLTPAGAEQPAPATETSDTTAPAAAACADQPGMHDVNGECVAIQAVDQPAPEAPPAPPMCADQPGLHDVNGECVPIEEPPAPEPAPEPQCTDQPGLHDVNGECVSIVPPPCTATPGMHDVNGECVPICKDGEKLSGDKCEAVQAAAPKNPPVTPQVKGKVQPKAPVKANAPAKPKEPTMAAANPVKAKNVSAANVPTEVSQNQTLPVTGSTTSTALAWAFGILLAGAAMGLSARAVRGH